MHTEPSFYEELMYDSYREEGLDSLPEVEVSYEVRVLVDGEEVYSHDYPTEQMMAEDEIKRLRAVQNYRKELLAEQFGETD